MLASIIKTLCQVYKLGRIMAAITTQTRRLMLVPVPIPRVRIHSLLLHPHGLRRLTIMLSSPHSMLASIIKTLCQVYKLGRIMAAIPTQARRLMLVPVAIPRSLLLHRHGLRRLMLLLLVLNPMITAILQLAILRLLLVVRVHRLGIKHKIVFLSILPVWSEHFFTSVTIGSAG